MSGLRKCHHILAKFRKVTKKRNLAREHDVGM